MFALRVVILIALVAAAAAAHAQPVQGQVDAVGFQVASGFVIRVGQWFPIIVTLKSQGSQTFAGELRAEGIDLDGDRVAFTRPQVTVSGEAGRGKQFWCYATANATNELPSDIAVIGQDGALVTELPLPPCAQLLSDDLLVLDISDAKVTALNALQVPGSWSPGQRTDGVRRFYRNVVVGTLPRGAKDLPDRWWGLEAVNVIVWDQPDPAALTNWQRDTLVEWVRNGGQLIIGIGPSWGTLSKSDLAPILPLAGEGATQSVQGLELFLSKMALSERARREFREPIPVTMAKLADGAVRTLGDYGPGNELINLIAMRLVGSGRVVTTAATLRDLTSVPISQEKFFGAMIDLNRYTKEFTDKELESAQISLFPSLSQYEGVVNPVDFGGATALRGLTAFLFVAGYVVLATLASWVWLRGRGLIHLSWTVFAGFAVVASAVSLATVGAMRGFTSVKTVSILDGQAGTTAARAFCLFGYSSPTRQRVGLSLPGEGNFLRPLARNPRGSSFYVTPVRYAALPAKAELDNVLMRATLKQFEGCWHGELSGAVRGQLVADRQTGRVTPASWLANDMSVTIEGGYLLYIDPRLEDGAVGVPWRVNGLTTQYELSESVGGTPDPNRAVPPALNILAVRVPKILAGQQVSALGKADYDKVDESRAAWSRLPNRKRGEMPDLRTLWLEQQAWTGSSWTDSTGILASMRTGLSGTERGVLLASTRNYHLHNKDRNFDSVGTPISTDGLPDLDVTHWLLQGQAVLVCWANDPGPARLQRNGRPLDSSGGESFYRVRIPIDYTGSPPQGEDAP